MERRWGRAAFRARKGDQGEVAGFGGPRPTDKKDGQERTVRQIVVTNFRIQEGEGPPRGRLIRGDPAPAGSPRPAPARGPARPSFGAWE
jgi:hypothetical protein